MNLQEKFYFVYITAPSEAEAKRIGRTLIEERLAGCINVFPQIFSIYYWKDQLNEETEALLIAKTVAEHLDRLTQRVKELHPYEVPCVVAVPAEGANPDYLLWLKSELR